MSIETATAYLDWPKGRLYKLAARGEIPHRKHGNRLLFRRDEIDAWLDGYTEGPVPTTRRRQGPMMEREEASGS
jgi:excisionase family DNA binding protein